MVIDVSNELNVLQRQLVDSNDRNPTIEYAAIRSIDDVNSIGSPRLFEARRFPYSKQQPEALPFTSSSPEEFGTALGELARILIESGNATSVHVRPITGIYYVSNGDVHVAPPKLHDDIVLGAYMTAIDIPERVR